jgi:hypothetical protein
LWEIGKEVLVVWVEAVEGQVGGLRVVADVVPGCDDWTCKKGFIEGRE